MLTEEEIAALQAENETLKTDATAKQGQIDSLTSKVDTLMSETKKAKADRKAADDAARQAAQDAATQSGDFEQLHKSSEEQRVALQEQLNALQGTIAKKEVSSQAMKLAVELADGPNAEILSTFIGQRLKHTDEGVKVLSETGELTVSTVNDLTNEFKNNARYASLLKGNQAGGGGSQGGQGGGGESQKTMPRADFDAMAPGDRMTFVKDGGSVHD